MGGRAGHNRLRQGGLFVIGGMGRVSLQRKVVPQFKQR